MNKQQGMCSCCSIYSCWNSLITPDHYHLLLFIDGNILFVFSALMTLSQKHTQSAAKTRTHLYRFPNVWSFLTLLYCADSSVRFTLLTDWDVQQLSLRGGRGNRNRFITWREKERDTEMTSLYVRSLTRGKPESQRRKRFKTKLLKEKCMI